MCEIDAACAGVLQRRFPGAILHGDIRTFDPPKADLVAGGWPCQDVSVAGRQNGLAGERSGLLAELLRVASAAGSSTVIAENVRNLLRMRDGQEFRVALEMFHAAGFPYVTWRLLNARAFGLPQHRTRLLIIASMDEDVAMSIFRRTPELPDGCLDECKISRASGFYWTGGTHSINYSRGYVPTVKVGSALDIPSPPAIHYGDVVRLLTPGEALRLQGFDDDLAGITTPDLFRMAGNAVARPIGRWVFRGVEQRLPVGDNLVALDTQMEMFKSEGTRFGDVGISISGEIEVLSLRHQADLAVNLVDYIDFESTSRITARAAGGLRARLAKSGQSCPPDLLKLLDVYARDDGGPGGK